MAVREMSLRKLEAKKEADAGDLKPRTRGRDGWVKGRL